MQMCLSRQPALIQGTEERIEQQRRISHCGSSAWCQVRYTVSKRTYRTQKQEKESSFPSLIHHQGPQCFPRPTAWEPRGKSIFSKCTGKPRHMKCCHSGFKEKDVILSEISALKRYCPLPHKLFTRYCLIWETAILGQGKMEK